MIMGCKVQLTQAGEMREGFSEKVTVKRTLKDGCRRKRISFLSIERQA
jgi:hypothetical protein